VTPGDAFHFFKKTPDSKPFGETSPTLRWSVIAVKQSGRGSQQGQAATKFSTKICKNGRQNGVL
jgi:hypothetical protein